MTEQVRGGSTAETHDASSWPGHTGNWGRWADPGGALNLVDSAARGRAGACAQLGQAIACARPLDTRAPAYYPAAAGAAFEHQMITAWKSNAGGDVQAASDQVLVQNHGLHSTHIDGLCHIGHRGKGFDGVDFDQMVTMEHAALSGSIAETIGLMTRGVLADVPRALGVPALEPGTAVTPDMLHLALPEDVQPGDAVLVRTASHALAATQPVDGDTDDRYGRLSGLHPESVDMLAGRDIALIGTDGPGDTFPVPIEQCPLPVHVLALVYWGIHLVHNMDLEALMDWAHRADRSHVCVVLAPLNIPGGTGSALTPLAIV